MKGNIFRNSSAGFDRADVLDYIEAEDNELFLLKEALAAAESEAASARAVAAESAEKAAEKFESFRRSVSSEREAFDAASKENERLRRETAELNDLISRLKEQLALLYAKNNNLFEELKSRDTKRNTSFGSILDIFLGDRDSDKDRRLELCRKELEEARREIESLKNENLRNGNSL